MTFVAYDIETCPLPIDQMSEAQLRRHDKELRRQLERTPAMDEHEASRLVRSIHPMLGWICCISAVSGTTTDTNTPRSWTAENPDEEGTLLTHFWSDVAGFNNVVWVTFNGKRFDAPWLLCRSSHYRLSPSRTDLLNTYPFRHRPHADLATIWPQSCSLDDLCDHLSIPSPKGSMSGALVADAVASGAIDEVELYCSRDVLATLQCIQAIPFITGL